MELLGQRFGHIRVTGVVGQGGMGEVYAGFDETLERKVALKVVHEESRLDDEARERLLREARALSHLDHANICRIYDYIETGDSDLLVLEFIDGRTLTDAGSQKKSRAEKLRIAISIAEVLVVAHRAGILHRDLKPDNVMLTTTDEVKVLDFGLARWLNHPRPPAPAPEVAVTTPALGPADKTFEMPRMGSGGREFLATQTGVAMGTPMYMSPEQARGEELTPASDMFAFGLVLQALFTGQEPHPEFMGSREVMLRVAHGETNPVRGVARDIEALINRLKEAATADRPTAVETLERLKWLAGKPGRVARRGIAAAILLLMSLGVWRYTVDLQRERAAAVAAEKVAVAERAEAVQRRGQAEDLIDFMMGDLHRKLAPVGRLDVLDAAADRALAYMSTLRPEMMSADELARNATALQHLGEVRLAQGKLPDALRAFELSEAIAQKAAADPRKLEHRFTLGQTQFWVGETHRVMGNRESALKHMQAYLATSEALARAAPRNLDYQIELAYGYSNIGSLLEAKGDFAGALQQYERCVAVKRGRLRTDPANRAWQGDLGQTINKMGFALQQLGRLEEARRRFEEEQAIYVALVDADPKHTTWKTRLVNSHGYLGVLLTNLGDLDGAEQQFAQARAAATELVEFDRQQVVWRRDLAAVLSSGSVVQRMQGRFTEARTSAALAETLAREAVREAPQMLTWRRDVANATMRHAEALYASGARAAAGSRVESVLAGVLPDDPAWLGVTAEAMILRGRIAFDQGQIATARNAWTKAAVLLADAQGTHSMRLLDYRARALLLLGRSSEAAPILDQLRRVQYANPDLVRLSHLATDASPTTVANAT